jgi:hypothetical protein
MSSKEETQYNDDDQKAYGMFCVVGKPNLSEESRIWQECLKIELKKSGWQNIRREDFPSLKHELYAGTTKDRSQIISIGSLVENTHYPDTPCKVVGLWDDRFPARVVYVKERDFEFWNGTCYPGYVEISGTKHEPKYAIPKNLIVLKSGCGDTCRSQRNESQTGERMMLNAGSRPGYPLSNSMARPQAHFHAHAAAGFTPATTNLGTPSGGFAFGGMGHHVGQDAPRGSGGGESGCQVYVSNLPWSITGQDFKKAFLSAGNVVHAHVSTGSDGRSQGWGTVEFTTSEEAAHAIQSLHNTMLNGRVIVVRPYLSPATRSTSAQQQDHSQSTSDSPPRVSSIRAGDGLLPTPTFGQGAMLNAGSRPGYPLSNSMARPQAHFQAHAAAGFTPNTSHDAFR